MRYKLTKTAWEQIGREAGWMREAYLPGSKNEEDRKRELIENILKTDGPFRGGGKVHGVIGRDIGPDFFYYRLPKDDALRSDPDVLSALREALLRCLQTGNCDLEKIPKQFRNDEEVQVWAQKMREDSEV